METIHYKCVCARTHTHTRHLKTGKTLEWALGGSCVCSEVICSMRQRRKQSISELAMTENLRVSA